MCTNKKLTSCRRHKEHEILLISAQYRLDYTIMKQPGECPSSDKWSPATDHFVTTRHNYHRHCNRNCCHHRHHQHRHYHHHYHHQQHRCYNQQYASMNLCMDKTSQDDDRYCSSFQFSVIFVNVRRYSRNDDYDDAIADADADADADDDDDIDTDARPDKLDNSKVFLTENVSRFMVSGIPFASSYVW